MYCASEATAGIRGETYSCSDSCGTHGTCFMGKCWCDPRWTSSSFASCSVAPEARYLCATKPPYDDTCMDYDEGWGRLRVSSDQRHKAAQNCELDFWRVTQIPRR